MRLLKFLVLLPSFLLISCAHGPKVSTCISDPALPGFACSTFKGVNFTVTYDQSKGYAAYSAEDAQKVLNYCAARTQEGTQAPQFDSCESDPQTQSFHCTVQLCSINPQANGLTCKPSQKYDVAYANSENYVAFRPSENISLLAYCNISIKKPQ